MEMDEVHDECNRCNLVLSLHDSPFLFKPKPKVKGG